MEAQFAVGQVVHHRLFDYLGVIYDVDPTFQGSEEWYREVARSQPPRDRPWYRVLVDGAEHSTYVAERNLESVEEMVEIDHPLVSQVFQGIEGNFYILSSHIH